MATPNGFSKDFPLDKGIFTAAKLSLAASTDANVAEAILKNEKFPDGDTQLGHISFAAESGKVTMKPVGEASVSFDIGASAQTGAGVYAKAPDAVAALHLAEAPNLNIAKSPGERFLLMDWGYTASLAGSATNPIGVLGSVSFGVEAKHNSVFAILHRFGDGEGARDVVGDTIKSWMLPRQVGWADGEVNLKAGTWLLAEADGSLAFTLATGLGWNMSFAKDARLLGVTHDLSAKVDANLKANLGFSASGKYLVVVGRESADPVVRLRLYKQSTKGLNFGLNLDVGVQGSDPQLPASFDDFIESVFGVHGLQVLNDLSQWTDPSADLGQKMAGLAQQTALHLLKEAVPNIDPAAEFDKAKQALAGALDTWTSLPKKLSSMLWNFIGKKDPTLEGEFKTFLSGLANPKTTEGTIAATLQKVTFGDSPEGQFLEAVADKGLMTLSTDLQPVSTIAGKSLNILDGGFIERLQNFINQKLDLNQIRKAATDADFSRIETWLKDRLAMFLDKEVLGFGDLRDIQKAIHTLDEKAQDYYSTAVQALTNRYRMDFAATYQKTTSDSALIDVNFDLSKPAALALFRDVVAKCDLNESLVRETSGVKLNKAMLTHEISRKATVELHMPLFDFSATHVNDAMASLTAEDHAGRILLYQISAEDKVTVANRAASQLSILASLKFEAGKVHLASDGSIAYEMRQVKRDMRPLDLEERTTPFIHQYLEGLFGGGDSSIRSFYTDLDNAITAKTHDQSNHLGDMAVSMQLSLPPSVLTGWFQPRSPSQLRDDQMQLSRSLQVAWKKVLPGLYFQDLSHYQPNDSVAALLVWSSLTPSTSIEFEDPQIKKFNTDKDAYWNYPDVDLRRAIARDEHTIKTLSRLLSGIHNVLLEESHAYAGFFDPSMAGDFIEHALSANGDVYLKSLLSTEAQLVDGATKALKEISGTMSTVATRPTQAIKTLAQFAGDLTDTFNQKVKSVYAGMSDRVVGPMLLVEASVALGSAGVIPDATLTLYALNTGHTFNLNTFVNGTIPSRNQIALTQTLVSPRSS